MSRTRFRIVGGAPFVGMLTAVCLMASASALANGSSGWPPSVGAQQGTGYSATLEQCTASNAAGERSATFTAQMVATSGTRRMEMRIDLQRRRPGEQSFHTVLAAGLGVWRGSEPGVTIYKYVKQISNLTAPSAYRAVVRFRWLDQRGRVIKRAGLRTAPCEQLPIVPPAPGVPTQGSPTSPGG